MTSSPSRAGNNSNQALSFLFDFDGTVIGSVYQHVLAWHEAQLKAGIELSVWRIHRRIAMSEGLLVNALARDGRRSESTSIVAHRNSPQAVRTGATAAGLKGPTGLLDQIQCQMGKRVYNDPVDLRWHLNELGSQ